MYLFVFIFLLISIMGIYTQLYLLQAARFVASQKAAAQTMFVWHQGAYSLAKENAATIALPPDCFVSPADAPACGSGALFAYNSALPRNYLPMGYPFAQLQWPSLVYETGGSRYLFTYVAAGTFSMGYSTDEMLRQMHNARFPDISYGKVIEGTCAGSATSGLWIATTEYVNLMQICFPVPATWTNTSVGTVGFISIL